MSRNRRKSLRWMSALATATVVIAAPLATTSTTEAGVGHCISSAGSAHRDFGRKKGGEGSKKDSGQRNKAHRPAPNKKKAAPKPHRRKAQPPKPARQPERRGAQPPPRRPPNKPNRESQRRQDKPNRSAPHHQRRPVQRKHTAAPPQRRPVQRKHTAPPPQRRTRERANDRPPIRQRNVLPRQTDRKKSSPQRLRYPLRSTSEHRSDRDRNFPATGNGLSHRQRLPTIARHEQKRARKVISPRPPEHGGDGGGSGPPIGPDLPNSDASGYPVNTPYNAYTYWSSPSYTYFLYFANSFKLSYSFWYGCSAFYTWYCAPYYRHWSVHGPWYHYWPYYIHYCLSWPSYVTYYSPSYDVITYDVRPCWATTAEAWTLLAEGRASTAFDAFDCLSKSLPGDGLPVVGYGLSAALLGLHDSALAAMREALRTDPEALHYIPDDDRLAQEIADLVRYYEDRARHTYGDVDALFMVAALRYMLGELPAADYALDVAITLGDVEVSTLNLESLIESSLAEEVYDLPPHD